MFRTLFSILSFSFFTLIFGTYGVLLSLIFPNLAVKAVIRPWAKCSLRSFGVKLLVDGIENIPEEPSIIMYNHQSSFDILAFCAGLPFEWRAMMKKEVARMPFVGWVPKLSGHYFVARDGSSRDSSEIRKIVQRLKNGPSVLIAPEGTRSKDGKLLPFKEGGFMIAMISKVPVVPMVISGGNNILPKDSFRLNPGYMNIKILPPIYIESLSKGKTGRHELMDIVRKKMENELD